MEYTYSDTVHYANTTTTITTTITTTLTNTANDATTTYNIRMELEVAIMSRNHHQTTFVDLCLRSFATDMCGLGPCRRVGADTHGHTCRFIYE